MQNSECPRLVGHIRHRVDQVEGHEVGATLFVDVRKSPPPLRSSEWLRSWIHDPVWVAYILALVMREAAGADDCWTHDVIGDWQEIIKGNVSCDCQK